MKRYAAMLLALGLIMGTVNAPMSAYAEDIRPAATATRLDPEFQRLITILATTMLAQFAAQASRGTLDGFDPGPVIESTLRGALNSRELHAALNRIIDQAGGEVEGSVLTPEMRALIKVALSGVVAMVRNEIAGSLANEAKPGSNARP